MIFLLDTNAFGDLLRGQSQMTSLPGDSEVVTCVIVVGEILYGLEKMQPGKRRRQLVESYEKLFEVIPWVPVPDQAVSHYARTKGSCQRRGLSLDENDLWIAATAMALGATVISRDSDFSRVEGLSLVHPDHITDTDFGDYLFEVPDGRYNVNVESVELTSTNSSGEPMLKWALRIGGGTSYGHCLLWHNKVISANSLPHVIQDLRCCGLELRSFQDLPSHLGELKGVRLEITKRTKSGRYSIYFEKRLT